jgi:site-specific DNA recombinase
MVIVPIGVGTPRRLTGQSSLDAGPAWSAAIARGRRWLDDVVSGRVTRVAELCAREKCSVRQVNMTISLAFLAPTLVKAAVEGRLPRGIGVERLRDPPTEWSRQFEALGLNPE